MCKVMLNGALISLFSESLVNLLDLENPGIWKILSLLVGCIKKLGCFHNHGSIVHAVVGGR